MRSTLLRPVQIMGYLTLIIIIMYLFISFILFYLFIFVEMWVRAVLRKGGQAQTSLHIN